MIIPKEKQKLTYIVWQDAHSNSEWFTQEDLEETIKETACWVQEVGWIIYEDKKEIHLCSRRVSWKKKNYNNVSEYGMYQRIPKTWIKKRKVIKI